MVRHPSYWSKTLSADIALLGNIIVQYKCTKQKQSEMSFQRLVSIHRKNPNSFLYCYSIPLNLSITDFILKVVA